METNRSVTRVFHCAHHPDVCWWYLSEFGSHHMGTGAADVAWHWCYIKACEWQHEGRGNYAWALRAASPPSSPPATLCFTRVTSWSWPPCLIIDFDRSWHCACLLLSLGLRRISHGPSFSAAMSSFSCHSLARSWAVLISQTVYKFPGKASAHIQKTKTEAWDWWAKQSSHTKWKLKDTKGRVGL